MASSLSILSPEAIRAMSYNGLIAVVRETNRIPGGARTVHTIANRCFLNSASRVLEIGTSTGATAIELAHLTGCTIVGIDVNSESLAEASRRADEAGVTGISFREADATALPFQSEIFDTVICGNVTSLIAQPGLALAEYDRVLRWGGCFVAVPMYYRTTPPDQVVEEVRRVVQAPIRVAYRDEALDLYISDRFDVLDTLDFAFESIPPERVEHHCDEILARPHLHDLQPESFAALDEIYRHAMHLFRVNLSMMGFSLLVLRKRRSMDDRELFVARPV